MNQPFQITLPAHFDARSRVWIYQSSRQFTNDESAEIKLALQRFVQSWQTHGTPVKGYADLLLDQFIVLMADETAAGVSGCSTDSSVRLVKAIETNFNTDLFNRQQLAFYINQQVQLVPMQQLQQAADQQVLQQETLYFNNTVLTKAEMESNWLIPIKKSWLANRISWPALVQ